MLLLRSFVSHKVADRIFGACKMYGVRCLLIDQGYGASRIAAALREQVGSAKGVELQIR